MLFPTICVDDFYKEPQKIRNFALSLDYQKDLSINPGIRTDFLHNIDKVFFDTFCEKLFSIFYNFNFERCEWKVETKFQKTFHKSENVSSILNMGWNHLDGNVIAAGVIYLNIHPNPNSGTTISELKNKEKKFNYDIRNEYYSDQTNVDIEKYKKSLIHHDDNFEDSIIIKNKFNRMICYDSYHWHKESNFFTHISEPRLTQVFFIHDLKVTSYPLERSNLYFL